MSKRNPVTFRFRVAYRDNSNPWRVMTWESRGRSLSNAHAAALRRAMRHAYSMSPLSCNRAEAVLMSRNSPLGLAPDYVNPFPPFDPATLPLESSHER